PPVAGRDPQFLRPAVPYEAGRGAGSRDRPVVRGDEAGQVRVAVRRAVRVRSLRDARLDLRAHARGVRPVGGREPGGKGQEMSATSASAHAHVEHAGHHELGFIRTYVFSTDHKMIARQFLFLGLLMMILGGLLALVVRWELAWPETPVPGLGRILTETGGILEPSQYNMAFTMHATIMIFFVIMPILAGAFGNFCIPLMIGARDMAFPFLNMLSFWTTFSAGIIMLSGFFVEGGHAAAGWTSYAPLSAVAQYTGVNWGQNLWCISLFVMGVGSMMGSINYITTIVNMRAPGMHLFRMPLVVWSLFITAILLLLALPALTSAVAILLFDRTLGTSWFAPSGGGEPLLWQHLFWHFGHQDVQLAGHAVGRTHPVHRSDAERGRLRVHVRHRWALRHLHGQHAGGHLHPGHVLHRRPHPLRRLRRLDLRRLRRHLLLVPQDVRPDDQRAARPPPLLGDLHLLQLHVLPH